MLKPGKDIEKYNMLLVLCDCKDLLFLFFENSENTDTS